MILLKSLYECPHHPALTHHDINLGRINTVYFVLFHQRVSKAHAINNKKPSYVATAGFYFLNQPTFVGD